MADPTLKCASVTIRYSSSDGYRSEVNYSNIGRMGTKPAPEAPLLDAIDELARVCALFGFGDEAEKAIADACQRVKTWRQERKDPTP